MSYEDNILIKLRRNYSKDETVSALSKRIQELEIELGKANAYIIELEELKNVNELIRLRESNQMLRSQNQRLKKLFKPIL